MTKGVHETRQIEDVNYNLHGIHSGNVYSRFRLKLLDISKTFRF